MIVVEQFSPQRCLPFEGGCCVLLLSRSGAMKLSATVFRLSGLGLSGLVLFSKRVRVRGSFTGRKEKTMTDYCIIAPGTLQIVNGND